MKYLKMWHQRPAWLEGELECLLHKMLLKQIPILRYFLQNALNESEFRREELIRLTNLHIQRL